MTDKPQFGSIEHYIAEYKRALGPDGAETENATREKEYLYSRYACVDIEGRTFTLFGDFIAVSNPELHGFGKSFSTMDYVFDFKAEVVQALKFKWGRDAAAGAGAMIPFNQVGADMLAEAREALFQIDAKLDPYDYPGKERVKKMVARHCSQIKNSPF